MVAGPCLELSPVEDAAALVRAVVGLAVLGVEVQPGVHHGAVQVAEHAHLLPDDGKNKKKIGHYITSPASYHTNELLWQREAAAEF